MKPHDSFSRYSAYLLIWFCPDADMHVAANYTDSIGLHPPGRADGVHDVPHAIAGGAAVKGRVPLLDLPGPRTLGTRRSVLVFTQRDHGTRAPPMTGTPQEVTDQSYLARTRFPGDRPLYRGGFKQALSN